LKKKDEKRFKKYQESSENLIKKTLIDVKVQRTLHLIRQSSCNAGD